MINNFRCDQKQRGIPYTLSMVFDMGKKEKVIELLKKNTDGLTISEIAKLLKFSRNTIAVYLAELKGANLVRIREVGMAKLHYYGGKK